MDRQMDSGAVVALVAAVVTLEFSNGLGIGLGWWLWDVSSW